MGYQGVITVGNRSIEGDAWADQGRLTRTATLLRGRAGLVAKGVFRFSSFEEADAWMTRMMTARPLPPLAVGDESARRPPR